MSDVRTLLRAGAASLAEAGVSSPEHDAMALLAHAWGLDEAQVRRTAVMRGDVPADVSDRFDELLDARAARVPLQHLTGRAWFRHLELAVGPGVFVPRPETELLVDLVLAAADGLAAPQVVDLCTGSGAIALAVKYELPAAQVAAVELSPDAHAWAVLNRDRLGLDVRIDLADARTALGELVGAVDVVASNPPYIPDEMVPVDPEVRDHDPGIALYGGSADGLRIPLAIAARAADLLRSGGTLVMEHADSQGTSLPAALLAQPAVWSRVDDVVDLSGKPRHTVAVRA